VTSGAAPLSEANGQGSVATAIGLTTLITAAGYAVTLVQQALYARALGVNADTDALGAALAWAVGTTGLVGTTLATVFLPRYVRARQTTDAVHLRSSATWIALAVGGGLALLTFVGAPILAGVLTPGGAGATKEALASLLRLTTPLELTWPLVWLAVSAANARERYALAAASALLPPLPVIAILLAGSATVDVVALGYVSGTVLQLVATWALEPESRPVLGVIPRKKLASITRDLLPVGLAYALLSLVPLEVRGLASLHGTGAVAVADYASRLVLAGQQVLLSGLLAVTFTRWSAGPAPEKSVSAVDSVNRTLLWVALVGAAAVIVVPLVAVDLTRLVFTGGRFSQADASAVGLFIAWMAPGVAGHMMLMVALRALFAEGRIRPVMVAGATAVVVVGVVGTVGDSLWGLNGVAAGYSAGYLAAGLLGYVAVRWAGASARKRLAAERAFPIPPRDASLLAVHEDVR
jgi:putative peptidoglycan lipid II flippase